MNLRFIAHISLRALKSLQGNVKPQLKISKNMNGQFVEEKNMGPLNKRKHSIASNQNISIKMRILFFYLKLPMTYVVVRKVLLYHVNGSIN